jgi:hypothetical protein
MTEIETRVCGIPCIVRVTYWEPYVPAKLYGHPDSWYPEEGGYGEWEILDRNSRPAPWLEVKMTRKDIAEIDQLVFDRMERQHEYE